MAECSREDGGKGEKIAKCPMCERRFETWKTAGEHLKKYHEGMPGWKEALRSLPKDVCQYCGKEQSQLYRHEKTCKDSGKNEREEDCVLKNMDTSVPEVFLGSKLVRDTLTEFEDGNFSKMSDAQAFLALVVHLRNLDLGVRVVRNLTLGEVTGAVEEGAERWRMGKLHVTHQELQVIKDFTFQYGLTNNPAFEPFADATLDGMTNVLKKVVTLENPGLWNSGNKPPVDALGHKQSRSSNEKDTAAKPGKSAAKGKVAAGVSGNQSKEVVISAGLPRAVSAKGPCPGCSATKDITDDITFFQRVGEYLPHRYQCTPQVREQYLRLITEFFEYQKVKIPREHSLVRLGNLFKLNDPEDLPLLPADNWIRSFDTGEIKQEFAGDAYKKMLGFLKYLLEKHRGWHVEPEESLEMAEHLKDLAYRVNQALRQSLSIRSHRQSKE